MLALSYIHATQNDACVLYNDNMNKRILVIIFVLLIVNTAFASEIVKRITYSNGITLCLCNKNGNFDYCTEQDRQNSIEILKNPNIIIVKEVIITQPSNKKSFNEKCYNAQGKVQSGANLVNSLADAVRAITSIVGVNW